MNFSSHSPSFSSTTEGLLIEGFVCGPLETNVYLVLDTATNEAVVIDPSIQTDEVLARAAQWRVQGVTFKAIWNTHGHFDHVYDNARWKSELGLPIYAHPADAFFLENLREQAIWFGLPAPEITAADFELSAGQTLQVGNTSVQVLEIPGHSPGSVGFYFASQDICISGDVLFAGSVGRTDLPGCSEAELATSLRELFALPDETQILCGHGETTTVRAEKRSNRVAADVLARF
jgi:hydroxyacylglutathione hydrolase